MCFQELRSYLIAAILYVQVYNVIMMCMMIHVNTKLEQLHVIMCILELQICHIINCYQVQLT